ncbi:MAG: HigA family addiction module antidote protein [Azoarcus sp.]|jgi:addiction module HigA family antidote|nr:HigA family addiction module antidote protein [Azoarcus sp.]
MMFNPPPPAEFIREDVLPALGFTISEAADQLGVCRAALSRVLNGKAAITPEMAIRFEEWLKTPNGSGPSAESFLRAQASYDLWQARQRCERLGGAGIRRRAVLEGTA